MHRDKTSLFVVLISFVAIIISFLTLLEMKNQRELEVTPILKLNPFHTELISNSKPEWCDSLVYANNYFISGEPTIKPSLNLINLGFGPGLNVELDWDIDMSWINEFKLNKNIPDSLINFVIDENKIIIEFMNCGAKASYEKEFFKNVRLNHIQSSSMNIEPLKLNLPQEIILCSIALFKADWITNGVSSENNSYEIKSKHKLSITYYSIHEKKFQENYTLEIILAPQSSGMNSKNDEIDHWTSFNDFAYKLK